MQWRRNSEGKLSLWVKDPGKNDWCPYNLSKIYTPVVLEFSQFGTFEPGFRTAQQGLKQGYQYIATEEIK